MQLVLELDRNSKMPLYQQVYEGVRQRILTGILAAGQKLPSSRELAKQLAVSRSIATLSYEMLQSEGYIRTKPASGTFVSSDLPERSLTVASNSGASKSLRTLDKIELSLLAKQIFTEKNVTLDAGSELLELSSNAPSLADFPLELWRQTYSRVCKRIDPTQLSYLGQEGCLALKKRLAEYLNLSRAVKCVAEQIVVCAGSKQALDLVARIHLNQSALVAMEEPGYGGARRAFQSCFAELLPVPVDSQGLMISRLKSLMIKPKLIYVTPSHQYPLGGTMSLARRLELLAWSNENDCLIIEDDYDSEFRYGERPIPCLQGLDKNNSVIYIGTLSKTVFPALRLGYIVLPETLHESYASMQHRLYGHPPLLDQLTLAEFLGSGDYEKHLRRMRTLYMQKRELARREFSRVQKKAEILGDNAGMHFVLRLPFKNGLEIKQRMAAAGIGVRMSSEFYPASSEYTELLIGFACLSDQEIKSSARILKEILRELENLRLI
ncbi:MAG: PLP-dependent aminotransferase family protein [Candidatus Obscuribacterales bacterium]|nr:PLP-dependent aminotransferase family protein [Candidatus Obscuribacterales bacterium]